MRKYLLLCLLVPVIGTAQVKSKKKSAQKSVISTAPTKPAGTFVINGELVGFPDGTNIDLLNGNNGAPEANTKLLNGKFSFAGKAPMPEFKIISINGQPPYITLFLDNSIISLKAKQGQVENAVVKGSASHNDFAVYSRLTKDYEPLFNQQGNVDPALISQASLVLEKFVKEHPASFITPLAIYRHHQLNFDADKMENMFGGLAPEVKVSSIGNFIAQQINENKKNPIGKPLADFSQEDTLGNTISLSSLRGKYVLVDFWASWCGPCRQENPNLVNMFNKFRDKNFTVLGVSLDKSKQPWLEAIKADALTWTHVSDLKGWNNAVAQQFQIFSIPQNFLLDPQGNVIAKNLRGPALDYKLSSLLK